MSKDVVEAIAKITADLPAIGKTDESSEVKYKFRGIETLIGHLAPLLAKHRLAIIPRTTLLDINREVENTKGKMPGWTETIMRVEWTIIGPEGGIVEAATVGIGRDNSDKGANKAQTQAFKYLLMEMFAIGDKEEDGDQNGPGELTWWQQNGWNDEHDHEVQRSLCRAEIERLDEATPGFKTHMAGVWKTTGLAWPMTLTELDAWSQRIVAEHAKFLAAEQVPEMPK